ncbi:MAG: hypothetical protein JXB39_10460 [Deltaproteobacteria bacterium]|nr:hypothetical protein [Deltaproteobacteria bacterium]
MSRRPGDRIAGRWRILSESRGTDDLRRWSVEDTSTGDRAEAVEPSAVARVRPGSLDGFRAATYQGTDPVRLPATLVESDEGPVAVRVPTKGTLADVPALDAEQALALARWLAPSLVPAAVAPRGRLEPEDLVVDGDGRVRLAPSGIPSAEGPVPRHTAPEVLAGAPPTEGSALFGLGVLLYRRLVGAWPWPASVAASWRIAMASAPTPASTVRPDLPPDVDALLTGLLSTDPARRVAAVGALGPGDPPRLVLPEIPVQGPDAAPALLPAPRASSSGDHLVVANLAKAPDAVLALASALTGFDTRAIERAGPRGVVVARASGAAAAAETAARLEACGLSCRVQVARFPVAVLAGGAAGLAFMAAGVLFVVSRLAAVAAAGLGAFLAVIASTRPRRPLSSASPALPHRIPAVAALERRVVHLLARLPDLPLPTPALCDLRDDLHALLERTRASGDGTDLDDLVGLVTEAEATLRADRAVPQSVDAAAFQRRLAAVRATRREVDLPPTPEG